MSFLFIRFSPEIDPDQLDPFVKRILYEFPGAHISLQDWYETKIATRKEIVEKLKEAGRPVDECVSVDSLINVAHEVGPAPEITIPMPMGGVLKGRVSRAFILLLSESKMDEALANCLVALVREMKVLKDWHVS